MRDRSAQRHGDPAGLDCVRREDKITGERADGTGQQHREEMGYREREMGYQLSEREMGYQLRGREEGDGIPAE